MIDSEYQKAINRQGSKKLIQGSYIMSGQSKNLFMQNKLNFKNAGMKFQGGGVQPGGYEYDIDLPKKEDAGSNQGSAIGHYSEKDNFVKKSLLKHNDILNRDMDMSPKSSKKVLLK